MADMFVRVVHSNGVRGMDELALGEWLLFQTENLRSRGIEGAGIKMELRYQVRLERHKVLSRSIGAARAMEQAWRVCADCLEKELIALRRSVPEMRTRSV